MALAGAMPAAADDGTKPSFDCRQVQTRIEREICDSKQLAALDRAMDELYRAVVARAQPPRRDSAEAEQRQWLRARNALCKAGGDETECLFGLTQLTDLYKRRVFALAKDLRGPSGAEPQATFVTGRYLTRWPLAGEMFLAEMPDGSALVLLDTIYFSYAVSSRCEMVARLRDRRGGVLHYRNANISRACGIEIAVTGSTAVLRETPADCNDLEKHHCEEQGRMRGRYERSD